MANSVAQYLMAHARQYGLDPRAVIAIARQEGLGGGVGDHGTSFGPFQLHEGGALPRGIAPGRAQAWATSPAGMNYALSRIASVARGLHGAQAISAISRRFERPADPSAEIAGAIRDYGRGAGSSPAVSAVGQLMASVGGGGSGGGGVNPRQLMSQYLLQEAQSQLTGQGNSVDAQGQGLLQMALMRKALQSSSGPAGAPKGASPKSGGAASFDANPSSYSNITALPGVNISRVDPKLLAAINEVAKAHGVKVTINSGWRSPQHSVAVGGFANDPHTRGVAVDAYVNGKPIGDVFGPQVWAALGVQSGNVPGFYNGQPDPEHLQIG
jgi:hypothetical protein